MVQELTGDSFEPFIKSGNTIIDFWAEWCGPCRMMEPQFIKASERIKNAKFAKVNVDNEYELAGMFQIMSIPTTLFFKNGLLVDRVSGAMTADAIERKTKEHFA